jgi:hypothetical protein
MSDELMAVHEVAACLCGTDITLDDLAEEGDLPMFRVRCSVRFLGTKIESFAFSGVESALSSESSSITGRPRQEASQ